MAGDEPALSPVVNSEDESPALRAEVSPARVAPAVPAACETPAPRARAMTETAETTETAAASGAGGAPAAQVIEASELWVRVQRAAGNRLTSIMEELRLETADQGAAVLVGPAAVVAMARANTAAIEDLFARAGGRPIKVEVRVEMRAEPGPVGAAPPVSESEPPPVNLNEHPLVKQAVELFGVKTPIRVMLRRKGEGSS